jgi:hypothetical protein
MDDREVKVGNQMRDVLHSPRFDILWYHDLLGEATFGGVPLVCLMLPNPLGSRPSPHSTPLSSGREIFI